MTTCKQRFNLVKSYLSAILFMSGSIIVGVDLLQNGDLKNAVVFVISGLIVSVFFLIASINYQKRIHYQQKQAILGEKTIEKLAELYAMLDELEKRG